MDKAFLNLIELDGIGEIVLCSHLAILETRYERKACLLEARNLRQNQQCADAKSLFLRHRVKVVRYG